MFIDYSYYLLYNIIYSSNEGGMMLLLTAREKNQMAEENFNLVYYVANSFKTTGIPHDELVGVGTVGYTKALNTYNSEKGAKFSTYAVYCIRNEILHFLRKEKKHADNTVLSGTSLYVDAEGNSLTIDDTISTKMNDEVILEDLILFKEDLAILMEAVENLPERERIIIMNRYGLNGGEVLTQANVGKLLGMSQANVSKLESEIIKKLSKELKGKIKLENSDFYIDYPGKITEKEEGEI